MNSAFSNNLITLMEQENLKQKDLAKKIGVTEISMSRYIHGTRKPKYDVVLKICEVLGCSVDYLLSTGKRDKMSKKKIETGAEIECRELFRNELKQAIKHHCDCINHYVGGCDSPFNYLQIRDVQEKLNDIHEILGIEVEE